MDQEVKAKWVAALRSGEYPQGKGALNRDGKFCCLGVLCDVLVKDGAPIEVIDHLSMSIEDSALVPHTVTYDGAMGVLPVTVKDMVGLAEADPVVTVVPHDHSEECAGPDCPDAHTENLSGVNDDGKTFEEIAEMIERTDL